MFPGFQFGVDSMTELSDDESIVDSRMKHLTHVLLSIRRRAITQH